jgi:hypothetical protein
MYIRTKFSCFAIKCSDLQDVDFGLAFIKICSWIPYAIKVYLNGTNGSNQFGHKIGDELLRIFTNPLKSSLRKTDIVARSGRYRAAISQGPARLEELVKQKSRPVTVSITSSWPMN